jgi:hypothetical protein
MGSRSGILTKTMSFIRSKIPNEIALPLVLLLTARLISILTLPLDGLLGYGDFPNFLVLARLPGWPFINYWVEYPPIFPFINTLLFRIAGGKEATYYYMLAFVLLLVDCCNLLVFSKIINRMQGIIDNKWRVLTYLVILIAVPYTWWEFDPFAVTGLLLGLYFMLCGRDAWAGAAIAFGVLVKLFPLLLLVIPWRYYSKARALKISIISLALVGLVYGGLYLASPNFAAASIRSQINKGSWETVWALIDGNYKTGLFESSNQRVQPETASLLTRNPPMINPILSLIVFAGLGLWAFFKQKVQGQSRMIAFAGMAFCLLFLWLPGWSPQWVLFLLPLLLLSLPKKEGLLIAVILIMVNLLEWPVLLSRGLFNDLWITIVLRTLVIGLAAFIWYQESKKKSEPDQLSP